jgi:para-nitrobenzyl esterase
VEGFELGDMIAFRGIPYAAPPVGELRFAPPKKLDEVREEVLIADEFGNDCAQAGGVMGGGSTSEDCLYLNVYRPKEGDSFPVMVWIHGGAFIGGSGGEAYSPARLVAEDVIVVTINYRLGALGFLAHPALTEEQDGVSGAYGLLDQKMALEWVRDNIEHFGGDPAKVTIFGESAGGHSVLSLMASPIIEEGLFTGAIVQSGSYQPEQRSLATAHAAAARPGAFDDCPDVTCLRDLDVGEILERQEVLAAGGVGLVPNYGSKILPHDSIEEALAKGSFQRIPVMTGTNSDEWTLFVGIEVFETLAKKGQPPSADQYTQKIGSLIGSPAEDPAVQYIAAAYPLSDYGDSVWQAMGAIGTDAVFACNGLKQAQQFAPNVPAVYAYEFADDEAPLALLPAKPPYIELGASHSFEIQYLFGTEEKFSEEQVDLSRSMVRYWTRFAKTGNPNGDGDVQWPEFSESGKFLQLNTPEPVELEATDFALAHHCLIWNQ